MEKVRASGCIVTYNNIKTVGETLKTLSQYSNKNDFELFVVDNGSTDGTVEFIKNNYPWVKLIETGENIGFGKGHNFILDNLNSQYHFIINPDIAIKDDVVTKTCDYLDNNDDVGILSPRICFPDGRLQVLGKRNPKLKYLFASRMRNEQEPGKLLKEYAMLDHDLTKQQDIQVASGCFLAIRTDVFKKIGGFDDRYFMYFEDFDLSRTVSEIMKIRYYPDVVVYHEWGRDSKRNMKLKIIHISSMIKYFLKWTFKK